jgi:hypothetical protein
MEPDRDGLRLEYERLGDKLKLTARWRGEPIFTDTLNPASALRRKQFTKAVKQKLPEADSADLDRELLRIADAAKGKPAPGGAAACQETAAELVAKMPEGIRAEAEAMLTDPLLIQRIVDDVAALNVAGEKELTATVYLIGVSRLLDRPLAGIVQGPTSSGKSYLIEKTASLFPAETVIHATQMTPQALFHMRPRSMSHRFIVAGERSRIQDDEKAEANRALREMLSAGMLTKLMPMKVEGGIIETVPIEQDGPIAYVESTTLAKIFDEDANRCLMLHTDERPDQTKRIIRQLASAYSQQNGMRAKDEIILRHHALQRMLQPLPVVIPYAERLGELIPSERVEVRRAFAHLLNMVQAITLLHQQQRKRDSNEALFASEEDYQIGRHLLLKPMARLLGGGISDPAQRFYERLRTWTSNEFTTTEARRRETSSKSAVSGWLAELHEAGRIELVEASRGRTPATWRLSGPADFAEDRQLPTVQEVFPNSAGTHGREAQTV